MSKPLEIFLFKGCDAPTCRSSYSVLLKHVKSVGRAIVSVAPSLSSKEINVVISDGRVIRGMNKRFRGIDKATDVLAFPLDEPVLGEVWLCPSVIAKNARLFDQEYKVELIRVLIHGILHLSGLDHTRSFTDQSSKVEKMFEIQEKVVANLFGE